ncbi:hypothetical protein HK096_005835, partial [Nowakowskiella sp. JEL0078]
VQWIGWAATNIEIDVSGTYIFQVSGVTTYLLDNVRIRGDTYRANVAKFPVYLEAGLHSVIVPVSSYGKSNGSFITTLIKHVSGNIPHIENNDFIVPDIVNGFLASSYIVNGHILVDLFSIIITNGDTMKSIKEWKIDVIVKLTATQNENFSIDLPELERGQSTSVSISIPQEIAKLQFEYCNEQLEIILKKNDYQSNPTKLSLRCRDFDNQSYRYTFLDSDSSVQKAAVMAPQFKNNYGFTSTPFSKGFPIIYTMHGASVEADSDAWTTSSYQFQKYAWILFPSNRGPYGYNWEGPGRVNGLNALKYLCEKLPGVPKLRTDLRADCSRLLVTGHSMGGHGALVFATRYPDITVAAAPASGWIKHDTYPPNVFQRNDFNMIDGKLFGLIESNLLEYAPDFYAANLKGVPFLIRIGSLDNIVPPWHLRRFARLLSTINENIDSVEISEIRDGTHWWWGNVGSDKMSFFFDTHINNPKENRPSLPQHFSIITVNPTSFGSRSGIKPLQQFTYGSASKISVERTSNHIWKLKTHNIRRLGFVSKSLFSVPYKRPSIVIIDDSRFWVTEALEDFNVAHFCRIVGTWQVCFGEDWKAGEKNDVVAGPARQVIQTAPVAVIYGNSDAAFEAAKYVAHELLVQGRFVVTLLDAERAILDGGSAVLGKNLVIIGVESWEKFGVEIKDVVKVPGGIAIGVNVYTEGFGILFLAPIRGGGLAVVVHADLKTLDSVCKLIPTRVVPHIAVPDYIVVHGKRFDSLGLGGVIEAGWWDYKWERQNNS